MSKRNDKNTNLNGKKRFDSLDNDTKEELLENRKAQNTNRATKQWVPA